MTTIKDYITTHQNGRVRIDIMGYKTVGRTDTRPLWHGMLYDVPEKFQDMELMGESWSSTEEAMVLEVLLPIGWSIAGSDELSRIDTDYAKFCRIYGEQVEGDPATLDYDEGFRIVEIARHNCEKDENAIYVAAYVGFAVGYMRGLSEGTKMREND